MISRLLSIFAWTALSLGLPFVSLEAQAKTLDTCFSPLGHCDQVLITWIDASRKRLDGAIYGLTDEKIAEAFIRAHQRGVAVRLVRDRSQSKEPHDVTKMLVGAGIPVHVRRGSGGGIQHNKFLIIDSTYVITGSFNWTRSASRRNDENFVILDDQAAKFTPEFERLWAQAPQAHVPGSKRKRRRKPARASSRELSPAAPPVAF